MNFSFKKYLGVFLLVILITVSCIPLMGMKSNDSGVVIDDPNANPPIIDEEDNEETTEKIPVFKNAFTCWNFAMDKLLNGAGYTITNSIVASGEIYGISQNQYIYYKAYHCGNIHYEHSTAYCELPIGKSFFREIYYNNGTVQTRETTNLLNVGGAVSAIAPNYTNEPIITMSYDEFCRDVCYTGIQSFPFDVNKNTAKQISFNPMNPDYYIFEISLDAKSLPSIYTENIKHNAEASNISFSSITFNCYVSKKTGKFIRMEKYEKYNMTVGFELSISSKCNYTLVSDKAITIENPFEK